MVSTLIAAVASGFGISVVAATFVVNFAVSFIVTRMFADNPETQQDMGVRQQVPPSAVNAIPIVYGDAYMGGTFVDAVLSYPDQTTMYYVLAISSISPNGQFTYDTTDMYFGDRKITFDSSDLTKVVSLTDGAGNVNTKINGYLYINLYKSTASGVITSTNGASAPSTVMGGSDIAVAQRWATSNRQMNGLAFAIVKMIYNRDADTTQLSPITFKVSHTLNGTGVAKAGDVWYDYITNAVYGGAVDTAFVNSASATALNTYGDQLITFTDADGNPATQARYRINGVLDAGQSVLSNIDRIMSACDSWMTYNAALGQWSVVVNKAESTAYAFDDDNIIGEIRVSATDITSSINQVEARFPFKENRDQAAFVNIETPSGLLYPNEPVNKYSITYDMVNDSVQAHYLANRLLEQAREDLIVSFSTTYYGIQVDAGDVVSVTNTDYGWYAKLFRVMKVNEASLPDGSLGARLEMSEYNAQVYDDQDITQFTPVPNSGLPSVSYFSPLAAPTVTGYPTATIPYINVQVFVPTTGRVTFGNLFWTTSATPTSGDWKLVTSASTTDGQPVTNGSYYTFANITLNTGTYYFAYNVGNDVTTSTLSPISSAFVWNPVAGTGPTGPTGATGTGGLNSATVYLYNKNTNTTPPALFSGTFTYTFATGVLSGGTLNGWSQTPPSVAAGEFLFLSLATASSTTATDTIPYTEFSTPEVISGTGTNGSNTAIVSLFNKNTSAVTPPTTFSGTFTYTFATAELSGGTLNGWSQSAPTLTSGEYLWQRQATAFSSAATDTIAATEFSSSVVVGAAGATGATGGSGDSVDIIFKRSATQPTPPSPSIGTPSGWYSDVNSVPAGSDPIWSSVGTNTGSGTNYIWQTPLLIEGQDGTNGLSVAELLIYIRATSTPSTPTGGSFDFTTKTLTAPSGWYSYVPTGTDPVYTSRSVASIQGITGTDSSLTWSTPTLSFQNGPTGPQGASITGPDGLIGLSSLTAYLVQAQNLSAPTFTTPTTGPNAPSGWSLTTPSVAVGQVLWYIQGRYNANAVTVDGVGAGQTAWTGPIAASVFQDIRSDNWDGGVPTTNAPTGTVGYYIKQSNGNMYLNSIFGRGVVQFDGATAVPSGGFAAATFNTSNSAKFGVYAESNTLTGAAVLGVNNNTSGNYTYALYGSQSNPNSASVYGYNYATTGGYGVQGQANGSTSIGGLFGGNTGVSGNGVYGAGVKGLGLLAGYGIECIAGFRWGSYTYAQPTGNASDVMLGNGTWGTPSYAATSGLASDSNALGGYAPSSWARIFPTNSGTANAGGSGLNLLGSTSTGIAGAYVGTSGTSNIVTFTVQTTSPSDVRLKEEIADSDLGLAFVKQLRPVSYKLKADPKHQKGYGFIADEVEEIIELGSSLVYHEPDWKVGDETGFKTIHYPSYIAVLTKAIQELSAKVESLEAQLKG